MRTFSERRKRPAQLEFGQFFNDLHDLNRLWTVRDLYGQTAPLPLVLRFFRSTRIYGWHARICDGSDGFPRQRCRISRTNHVFFRAVGLVRRFDSLPER